MRVSRPSLFVVALSSVLLTLIGIGAIHAITTAKSSGDNDEAITPEDWKFPTPEDWGRVDFEKLASVMSRLTDTSDLKKTAVAATFLVSRVESGPPPDGREIDLSYVDGVYQCTNRVFLAGSLIEYFHPEAQIRRTGMASVPGQGSHSTMEVFLPEQDGWGHFDPSSGTYFTQDGLLFGPVLSMSRIFASPDVVDAPGPVAPLVERRSAQEWIEPTGHRQTLETLIAVEPGYARSNFPLKSMLEQASAFGPMIPSRPIVNRIYLDTKTDSAYEGLVEENGRIRSTLNVVRRDGSITTWLNKIGISPRGLNVVPVYFISSLEAGRNYALEFTFVFRTPGFEVSPECISGCRLFESESILTESKSAKNSIWEISVSFRATRKDAEIIMFHNGTELNQRASIGRIAVTSDL